MNKHRVEEAHSVVMSLGTGSLSQPLVHLEGTLTWASVPEEPWT